MIQLANMELLNGILSNVELMKVEFLNVKLPNTELPNVKTYQTLTVTECRKSVVTMLSFQEDQNLPNRSLLLSRENIINC